jgi:hypothetical protein
MPIYVGNTLVKQIFRGNTPLSSLRWGNINIVLNPTQTTTTTTTTTSTTPLPSSLNFTSTENGATIGNAVVNGSNVSADYFGPNAFSLSMSTGGNFTAIGALFNNSSNTNSYTRSVKNSASGSTFNGGGSAASPFMIVIDLGQIRTFNHARYYQMFSDGKTTHAALDISSNGSLNTRTSINWTQIHPFVLLDNNSTSNGVGTSFVQQTARYLRLRIYNDERYGDSGYTELYNFKLFNI